MTNSKLKLYLYPNAKPHVHDLSLGYENTVPLSKFGIDTYCDIVGPDEADFFYMGQYSRDRDSNFSINQFEHFNGREDKHIIDLEGEGGLPIPKELWNSIVTVNGPTYDYKEKVQDLYVRPTFSKLLIHMARKGYSNFEPCFNRDLGFKGFINCPTRYHMFRVLSKQNNLKVDLEYNKTWSGPVEVSSEISTSYTEKLKKYAFSLCPRGSGIDSIRVWESCYYGRIPIIITDKRYMQIFEDMQELPFIKHIVWNGSDDQYLINKLTDIVKECSEEEIYQDQLAAKLYFGNVIRPMIQDPTSVFIGWLRMKGII